MKNEQSFEFQAKNNECVIYPINNNEYVFGNLIATIDEV